MKINYKFLSFLIITILLILLILLNNKKPILKLLGDKEITVEINNNYNEPGINATYLNKDISSLVNINGEVNTDKLGQYQINYELNFKNKKYKETRMIKVVDSTYPVINLLGSGTIELCPNHEYNELGFTAFDELDGDITNKVNISNENDSIKYYVEDSFGNKSMTERKIVRKDIDIPIITLKGYQSMTVYKNDVYFESGYKAIDNCDGDITDNVSIEGTVNTNIVGKYKLLYKVIDSSGNMAMIDRIINIVDRPNSNQKTIYFTFDDGPSLTTLKILDVLNEEKIKATFFVINKPDKYNYIIKRTYDEGHTIGLHSYSHKYKSIYKSEEAYYDDLDLINKKIKSITGENSNIIRFPGGSSNTISKIKRGLMTKLSITTKERGYIYFDWNIASSDTSNISYKTIIKRVKKQLGKYNTNIILMHDFQNNNKTVKALKEIIKYGKEKGYNFDRITELTPQIKHKINN